MNNVANDFYKMVTEELGLPRLPVCRLNQKTCDETILRSRNGSYESEEKIKHDLLEACAIGQTSQYQRLGTNDNNNNYKSVISKAISSNPENRFLKGLKNLTKKLEEAEYILRS